MEYGLPEPIEPEHKPDKLYPITFAETGETYQYAERWDRLVQFREVGAWVLKIVDDDGRLVEGWIDEDTAQQVIDHTGTEPHIKEQMTEDEYKAWQRSQRGEE